MQGALRRIRRHHLVRMKARARRIMKGWFGATVPSPVQVGIQASTPCRACSCFLCQLSCGNRGARFRRGGSGGFRAKWIGRSELTRSASDRTAEAAANAARQISQLGNVGRVDLAVRHRGKFLKAGERGFRRLSRLEFRQCRGYGFVLRLDLHSLFAPIESPSVPR